ncbi:hypothetical protein VNO77_42919 [Canavalia gladiata]|uniref:Leucine-rich repeat-containing N-terminal plant-type domain-containing protein n=1 Tax=Canavalia gladiata TaxID=3824 RepID=A0AAN9JVD6_CANGL
MVGLNSQVLIVLLLLLWGNSSHRVVACNQKDQLSLLIFKQGIKNSSDKLSSWSSDIDCCAWEGVQCDNITGRVTKLDLGNSFQPRDLQDLSGSAFEFDLSPDWMPPFQLHDLDLSNTIQDENFWSFVANIQDLTLSNNSIRGDLSEVTFENCFSLKLDYNNFTGGLPNISARAYHVDVSHNSLLGPTSTLCQEKNNEYWWSYVDVSYNLLTGPLPYCLEDWTNAYYISFGNNKLTGEIPLDLSNLKILRFMNLENNEFSGAMRTIIPPRLQVMLLSSNQLVGNIPQQLCNLSLLHILDLSHNKFLGPIPQCVRNMTALADDVSISFDP